jgi:hypothetical protein
VSYWRFTCNYKCLLGITSWLALVGMTSLAWAAEPSETQNTPTATKRPSPKQASAGEYPIVLRVPLAKAPRVAIHGYIETYWGYNFNNPDNGITNYRAFDNRHNTFTIMNAVLGADGHFSDSTYGRVVLQVGSTGDTYVGLSEPEKRGASGASLSNGFSWRNLQEAYLGWQGPVKVEAGLFLSPIGPEAMAIKDHGTISRSNLFYALPFYHTGIRVERAWGKAWRTRFSVFNGWNSVVDNNQEKSIFAEVFYQPHPDLLWALAYFGGIERSASAPEGRPWRHLWDTYLQWKPWQVATFKLEADVGWESTNFGLSGWSAVGAHSKWELTKWLYVATQNDVFFEKVAANAMGQADPIFWPVRWVSSHAAALNLSPEEHVAFRVEVRHDRAAGDVYFRGLTRTDPRTDQAVPNANRQTTTTFAATAWF